LKDKFKYITHMRKIIQRFQEIDLQINIKKCEFSMKYMKYLEFIINTEDIKVDFEKIEVIIV
jgi:hypothetical protein